MESLTQVRAETTETSLMVMDEATLEQLSQATNAVGLQVRALYSVETE